MKIKESVKFAITLCLLPWIPAFSIKSLLTEIGSFLGRYLAIVVLIIGYIVAVMPTGLIMKLVKRDRLRLKKSQIQTYWKKYENNNTDYEYQF